MRAGIVVLVMLTVLTGCATTGAGVTPANLSPLDGAQGRTIAAVPHETSDFYAMTAGKAMFGLLGAAAMYSAGKGIVQENGVQDPSQPISLALRDGLAREKGLEAIEVDGVSPKGGSAFGLADRYPGADYLLDVSTGNWGFGYYPSNWARYRVMHAASVRLIDVRQKKTVAEGSCRWTSPGPIESAPSREELLADGAARLKAELSAASAACIQEMAEKLLQLSPATIAALTAAPPAEPAPAAAAAPDPAAAPAQAN